MNTAYQWMVLQPADDVDGSMLLFAAWPCHWDVEFKLHGPRNTTVTGDLKNGVLRSLVVTPKSRTKDVYNMLDC
jgi:hypothetical protein